MTRGGEDAMLGYAESEHYSLSRMSTPLVVMTALAHRRRPSSPFLSLYPPNSLRHYLHLQLPRHPHCSSSTATVTDSTGDPCSTLAVGCPAEMGAVLGVLLASKWEEKDWHRHGEEWEWDQ